MQIKTFRNDEKRQKEKPENRKIYSYFIVSIVCQSVEYLRWIILLLFYWINTHTKWNIIFHYFSSLDISGCSFVYDGYQRLSGAGFSIHFRRNLILVNTNESVMWFFTWIFSFEWRWKAVWRQQYFKSTFLLLLV